MTGNGSVTSNDPDIVRDHLNHAIDIDMVDDHMMQAMVYVVTSDLAFGSAMWVLAEFVDRVIRYYDQMTSVPYDYLQSVFSGHRSATIRAWKKEQDAVPPVEELTGIPF